MLITKRIWFVIIFCCFIICSCGDRDKLAPIEEVKWQAYSNKNNGYKVQKGDTLYAIAFKYDMDYRKLAQINRISTPYLLKVGQDIRLRSISKKWRPKIHTKKAAPKSPPVNYATIASSWVWPIKGKITDRFIPFKRKKGINIAGSRGDKVKAANSGVVAYSGNGLTGYGNLIIIKHNGKYLTAYANNSKILVKEGQKVKRGQVIADIGKLDKKNWGIHFEIRKYGKPVNPLKYLKKA